jgi:metal-responsive CopG/Arc/MetJ family transcriptional regulator
MQTYSDAIEAILDKSVMLSPSLLDEVDSFMKKNVELGYVTKEEFIQDALRLRLASSPVEMQPSRLKQAK